MPAVRRRETISGAIAPWLCMFFLGVQEHQDSREHVPPTESVPLPVQSAVEMMPNFATPHLPRMSALRALSKDVAAAPEVRCSG